MQHYLTLCAFWEVFADLSVLIMVSKWAHRVMKCEFLFSFFSPYSTGEHALSQRTFWNFLSKMHSFHHFIYLLSWTVLSGHTEPNLEISAFIIVVFFSILWYVLQNMLRIDNLQPVRLHCQLQIIGYFFQQSKLLFIHSNVSHPGCTTINIVRFFISETVLFLEFVIPLISRSCFCIKAVR